MPTATPPRVLLTGATGYVGGRLLKRLEPSAGALRCLARRPEHLRHRVAPSTELVAGDVLDAESLRPALADVDVAFYLIHSMAAGSGFEELEVRGARNFAAEAKRAGVSRILYLGGLGDGDELSPHLESRRRVGRILRASGVPTLELRSSIVIGAGSLSFEMVRALVERLPIMVTPRWVEQPTQPIAVDDLLAYLVEALETPLRDSRVIEIGGADRVSYGDLMRELARQRGLRRWMIRLPWLTPRLSSLWLGLVTPVYARVGRALIDSLRHRTVVRDAAARELFSVRPMGVGAAIAHALAEEDRGFAATRWSDALSSAAAPQPWGGEAFGSRLVSSQARFVAAPPAATFAPVRRLGGRYGWAFGDRLWRLRAFLDLLVGGVGSRRGRRHPVQLAPGDTVDFWRVEAVEANRLLRLRAEMRLPGRAWLQLEVDPAAGGSTLRQTAIFDPVGLAGLLYWYALYPIHAYVFAGMLRALAERAEAASPHSLEPAA